jgi:hypothetical protein
VRTHLAEKSKTSHNFVVQLDQVFLGKGIDIEVIHSGHFLDSVPIFASGARLSQLCDSSTGLD